MTETELITKFQKIEDRFNEAVVSNDIERIKSCTTKDWVLVDARGGIIQLERFLDVVEHGILSHQTMVKQVLRAKVYGDTAVITGRGQNTGKFEGKPIEADEWITDVYRKEDDKWLCVLTHLTPVAQK